jgi:uncharacterized RDD family membrane protein YckC
VGPPQDPGPDPTGWSGSQQPAPPPSSAPPSHWQAPEYVPGPAPGYEFGGPGERLVAYIVDVLISGCVVIGIVILAGLVVGAGAVGGSGLVAGLGVLVILVAVFVVPLAYFPYFWARSGQTPGMKMFGLQVVRDSDGGPIGGGTAILRLVGYWVSGVVFYLGYIWIFIDKRKRGWHDLIAGTVVVKKL